MEIISEQCPPGVLILDHKSRILYNNKEAQAVLYPLSKRQAHSDQSGNEPQGAVPVEILKLWGKLRETSVTNQIEGTHRIVTSTMSFGSEDYSLRARLLDKDKATVDSSLILVLIEKTTPALMLDLEKVSA